MADTSTKVAVAPAMGQEAIAIHLVLLLLLLLMDGCVSNAVGPIDWPLIRIETTRRASGGRGEDHHRHHWADIAICEGRGGILSAN